MNKQKNEKVILTEEDIRVSNEGTEIDSFESRIRLMNAQEAGKVLGVNATTIYNLWKKGYLDFWKINGTMKTNMTAIDDFLKNYKNTDLGQMK